MIVETMSDFLTSYWTRVIICVLIGFLSVMLGVADLLGKKKKDVEEKVARKLADERQERIEKTLNELNTAKGWLDQVIESGQLPQLALGNIKLVLDKYQQMTSVIDNFHTNRNVQSEIDKARLANETLKTLEEVAKVKILPATDGSALILGYGENKFRVVFPVPMRISPNLEFSGIPNNVTPIVQYKSEFGFVVEFHPIDIKVTSFQFSASAQL